MNSASVDGYQVEVEKRGTTEIINLVVSTVRGARGRRKLLGEAFVRDPYTPVTYFRVKHAKDVQDLHDRFVRQLILQGFEPKRSRRQVDGRFEDWGAIDPTRFDLSVLDQVKAPADLSES